MNVFYFPEKDRPMKYMSILIVQLFPVDQKRHQNRLQETAIKHVGGSHYRLLLV